MPQRFGAVCGISEEFRGAVWPEERAGEKVAQDRAELEHSRNGPGEGSDAQKDDKLNQKMAIHAAILRKRTRGETSGKSLRY